jgi:hypothetical protein
MYSQSSPLFPYWIMSPMNNPLYIRVKCIFSTCVLSQNQIGTSVFKNITNGTCGYQINPLDTSIKIPLVFLTECHITLTHDVIRVISKCHVAWYLSFWMPHHIK